MTSGRGLLSDRTTRPLRVGGVPQLPTPVVIDRTIPSAKMPRRTTLLLTEHIHPPAPTSSLVPKQRYNVWHPPSQCPPDNSAYYCCCMVHIIYLGHLYNAVCYLLSTSHNAFDAKIYLYTKYMARLQPRPPLRKGGGRGQKFNRRDFFLSPSHPPTHPADPPTQHPRSMPVLLYYGQQRQKVFFFFCLCHDESLPALKASGERGGRMPLTANQRVHNQPHAIKSQKHGRDTRPPPPPTPACSSMYDM